MNIREWFGFEGSYKPFSRIDDQIDQLLVLYAKGICVYFGVNSTDFCNASELIKKLRKTNLRPVDIAFLDWFEKTGLPSIISLFYRDIPNNSKLIAQLEYEEYNLEEELAEEELTELRSCLINIISYLPDRITKAYETNYVSSQYTVKKEEGEKVTYVEGDGVCYNAGSFTFKYKEGDQHV